MLLRSVNDGFNEGKTFFGVNHVLNRVSACYRYNESFFQGYNECED